MFEDHEPHDSLSLGLDGNYSDQTSPHDSRVAQVNPQYNYEIPEINVIVKEEEEAWTFSDYDSCDSLDHPSDREDGISKPGAPGQDNPTGTRLHRCLECGKEYSSSRRLKRHQRSHAAERTFVCTACGKCFPHADRLKSHQCKQSGEPRIPGEESLSCPFCGQACAAREALERHMQAHASEEPYRCFVCGKTFPQIGNLPVHEGENTGEKLISCPECEKTLSQKENMKAHETSHAGEKYQSPVHGKCLSRRDTLQVNQQSHLEGYAQDQNLRGERSTPLSGEPEQHLENEEEKTTSGQRDSDEANEQTPEGVKVVSATLTDQTLRLTIRLQQGEREVEEEEEEVIGGFINSDGEEVDLDTRYSRGCGSDGAESSQIAHTSKGGGVPSESQVRGQNHRENGSPTLMMEVTTVEEEPDRDGGEEKEVKKTTASTYHVKTRGRKKKVPDAPVGPVDPPEVEKGAPKPGKRRGRKKKIPDTTVGLKDQPNTDGVPVKPAKRRYRKRKLTIPPPEGVKDAATPGKRRYKKRKVSLPCAEGATDGTVPPVKRRPGRKMIPTPIEIPPELLKPPKEKISYHCSVCGKDFPHAYKLDRHALTHTGEKPYCCSICGRGFNQKGNLKTHYKVHTGRKGAADWPGDMSPMTSGLPEYLETPPEETKVESCLRCLECGKECESLSALQAHHITTHTQTTADTNTAELQLYLCRRCGIQFSEKEQLDKHMKTHVKEKPYSCPDCGKRFINESYIEVHRRIHTGEKPFLCSQCGKGYHTASSLKLHEMQHNGDRPFACTLCDKKFRINSYLIAHYQTHIKDRPFLCSVCGKGYARAEELKVHHRIHTGERPYQCGECGKSFIYRQGLRQHQRTHAGRRIGPTRQLGRPKQQPRQENMTINQ